MPKRKYYGDNYGSYPSYPRTSRIETKGGMRVKSRGGEIAQKWWSKRIISILDHYGWSNRLQRGRSYARSGQVLAISVKPGLIESKVQGSRSTPYKITIKVPVIPDEAWAKIITYLRSNTEMVSQLLAGEVPPELENVFSKEEYTLFPKTSREIEMDCSCPDYATPCKHISATFYVFAYNLDTDPMMILQLRGKSRDEIVKALYGSETQGLNEKSDSLPDSRMSDESLYRFWHTDPPSINISNYQNTVPISPLKKYPPTDEMSDPLVASILEGYYTNIRDSLKKITQS